eukprot:Gregarina_sp_Poly_1__6882@NODE_372_length_9144_cov_60_017517_g307_i0_p1_GENE_NODE_372_length_9144_cov_60_017517_g307_i0NODE_372_length_9144_cov_60_017517_g307_i0_p1_ORF_typecomplete_len1456_score269_11ANAPC3/PF12895_7/0_00038ANAPC3/PF12895_7/0_02ANAPC3/PF12895_7/1_6e03ANAPC3/PF12895_7/3e06ANAPC3/PF12895_7/91TPR_19/PF14559_6/0_25TPR_19/PF14559_6/0_0018TPR_19/PF14559_6/6_5e03TPR_19/PF14559_6/21TPR_19/PF14559_6/0_0027TPR_19/PF14559_6/8_9TPR_15/PF13429_6/8_4e05TPR_15/PF13429_6/3_5e05TPR_15/PF13429_6
MSTRRRQPRRSYVEEEAVDEDEDDFVPASSESSWRNSQSEESELDSEELPDIESENSERSEEPNWEDEVFNAELTAVETIPAIEDSDFSDSELEEVLFGLGTTGARKKKKRKKRPLAYTTKRGKPKRRSAAAPSRMSEKAEKMLESANEFFLKEEYDEAISLAKQVVAEAPEAHEPLHLLGLIYETAKDDPRKALGYYFVAASYVKTDLATWKHVGRLAQSLGDSDVAIYCYRRVVPASKQTLDIDQECAYELARLFVERFDHRRASTYYEKLLRIHPGDSYLSLENSKCLYNLNDFGRCVQILEEAVAAILGVPNEVFGFDRKWIFLPRESPPKILEPLTWKVLEMLAGLYLESKQYALCAGVCRAMVVTHLLPVIQGPIATDLPLDCEPDAASYQAALRLLSPGLIVRFAAALISQKSPEAETVGGIAIDLVEKAAAIKRDDDATDSFTLYVAIADSYLEIEEPQRALDIYRRTGLLPETETQPKEETTEHRNSEFYIKVAKCYLQMKEFEKAAQFLESVVPRVASCVSMPSPGDSSPAVRLAERVREAEARLLLVRVLSRLEPAVTSPDEARLDIVGEDPFRLATRDNRISALEIGSSIMIVPPPISAADRQLMVLRLRRGLQQLHKASEKLQCQKGLPGFLEAHHVDQLPRPTVPEATIRTLLSGQYFELFSRLVNRSVASSGHTLTQTDLFLALFSTQPSPSPSPCRLERDLCSTCGDSGCSQLLERFVQLLRQTWISEFLLLVRDSLLDTRRVLNESSRLRAVDISRHLAKSRGFLGESATSYQHLPNADDQDPNDERVERRFGEFERKFLIRVKSKVADCELRRRQEVYHRGGLTAKISHHLQLRESLGLASLEDLLGWHDYGLLLLEGTRLLLRERGGRIAVDLIENAILNVRFSRVQGPETYAHQRAMFRTACRRISLRTSLCSSMMRIALSGLRHRFLLPLMRHLMKSKPVGRAETAAVIHSGLASYSNLLFNLGFAHHSAKSISASSEKDVIAFNRAWCARRLMQQPYSFALTMMVAHYCLFSMRWPYAVAEYTRALHLKPWNPVASLCLAAATVSFSTSRGIQDRHQVVLRGLGLFERFRRLRLQQKSLEMRKFRSFLLQKVERIFAAFKRCEPVGFESKMMALFKKLKVPNSGCPKSADSLPVIVKVMSREFEKLADKMTEWIDVYYESECMYNQARAYHHLSLEYLAFPIYMEVLDKLRRVREELHASTVGQLCFKLCQLLLKAKAYPCPETAIMELLRFSDYAPAIESVIQWSGGDSDCGILDSVASLEELCGHFVFARIRCSEIESRLKRGLHPLGFSVMNPAKESQFTADRLLFPQIQTVLSETEAMTALANTPPLEANFQQFPAGNLLQEIRLGRVQGKHPLGGLFADCDSGGKRAEETASRVMKSYLSDLPPSLFIFGVDIDQLRRCCALNLYQLHRRQKQDLLAAIIINRELDWS